MMMRSACFYFFIGLAVIPLAGCVSTAAQPEEPIPAITCKQGADCDLKWSRAITWVSENAAYKIQTQTDSLIQTFGPLDYQTGLAITVNRLMLKPGVYEIDARMGCANSIGCFPEPHAALRKFAAFLNG
jgi:hypothetical protein